MTRPGNALISLAVWEQVPALRRMRMLHDRLPGAANAFSIGGDRAGR